MNAGAPSTFGMVGLDSALLMNPKVWEASGHVGGFSDPNRHVVILSRAQRFVEAADLIEYGSSYKRIRGDEEVAINQHTGGIGAF